MAEQIADNTYMTYCSRLRKYRTAYKDTKDEYWLKQVTKLEAKILSTGRELPKDKVLPSTKIDTSVLLSPQIAMYKKAYQSAVKTGEKEMQERFKKALADLGVEVEDAQVA